MLRSVAVARIKQGLGFRTDLDDEAALMLQEAQRFYEQGKTLPWFLQKDEVLSLLEDTSGVSAPTDFLRLNETISPYYTDDEGSNIHLVRRTSMQADEAFPTPVDGGAAPEIFIEYHDFSGTGTTFYFYPWRADQDYDINLSYYYKDEVLDSDIENAWLEHAPELLIGEAGFRLALDLYDKAAAEKFDVMRKQAWDAVFRMTISKEEAQLRSSFGSDL